MSEINNPLPLTLNLPPINPADKRRYLDFLVGVTNGSRIKRLIINKYKMNYGFTSIHLMLNIYLLDSKKTTYKRLQYSNPSYNSSCFNKSLEWLKQNQYISIVKIQMSKNKYINKMNNYHLTGLGLVVVEDFIRHLLFNIDKEDYAYNYFAMLRYYENYFGKKRKGWYGKAISDYRETLKK